MSRLVWLKYLAEMTLSAWDFAVAVALWLWQWIGPACLWLWGWIKRIAAFVWAGLQAAWRGLKSTTVVGSWIASLGRQAVAWAAYVTDKAAQALAMVGWRAPKAAALGFVSLPAAGLGLLGGWARWPAIIAGVLIAAGLYGEWRWYDGKAYGSAARDAEIAAVTAEKNRAIDDLNDALVALAMKSAADAEKTAAEVERSVEGITAELSTLCASKCSIPKNTRALLNFE